jgi:exopolysaccharide biosynthesis polyprenyl glycosylphosphotransferase
MTTDTHSYVSAPAHEPPLAARPASPASPSRTPQPDAAGGIAAAVVERGRWQGAYARRLRLTDALAILLAVTVAEVFAPEMGGPGLHFATISGTTAMIHPWAYGLGLGLAWMVALELTGSRSRRVIDTGGAEYQKVLNATAYFIAVVAMVALIGKMSIGRWYLLIALAGGTVLLMASRRAWRSTLARARTHGRYTERAVVLGSGEAAARVIHQVAKDPASGLKAVGVLLPQGETLLTTDDAAALPTAYGDPFAAIERWAASTLIVASSGHRTDKELQEITWQAASLGVEVVMAPGLTDVQPSRLVARQVASLPLVHVEHTSWHKPRLRTKRTFDAVLASVLVLLGSPFLLLLALLVKVTSPGPVFYRQTRFGLNGSPFQMLKFRSMRVDADDLLPLLLDRSEGNGIMFKLRDDPRVTRFGKFIRRFSLDELPQLFNVIQGTMSLVGPRPPLPNEVDKYDHRAERRLLIKPGITGLWQVGGRADLSWDEYVRLDLYYVDNWTVMGDLAILFRTLRAVLQPDGAY